MVLSEWGFFGPPGALPYFCVSVSFGGFGGFLVLNLRGYDKHAARVFLFYYF